MTVEEQLRKDKIAEVEANFKAVKDTYTTVAGKTYNIDQEHLTDLIGLKALDQGSDLAVEENGVKSLVPHTNIQIATLLDEIRVYLTGIKTTRFNKIQQLEALGEGDHEQLRTFDTTI
jgi:hypothetical protein